nr:DUF305 domain-containing protein [Nocardioidaceae bacterium]
MSNRPGTIAVATMLAALALTGCGKDAGSTGSDADHNGADVKFAQMMIPHHQQAVEMSGLVLKADGVEP